MMCTVCGCGEGETRVEGEHHHHTSHSHVHADGHGHSHSHVSVHSHHHDYGSGPARAHAPGLSQSRMVQIEQDILGKNDRYAGANRSFFRAHGILALNLVSSPGAGKTTLLTDTIERRKDAFSISVIEGDQQTSNDAERIRETGVGAVQINTGKGCHLDAHMVGHALETLKPKEESVVFIENVGNLVCPAAFDLGEAHKVVILSVTEGEDKPIKYPDMFHAADLMLLSKIDLVPHLRFDIDRCIENAYKVNSRLRVLKVSAETGQGMDAWCRWIDAVRQVTLIGRKQHSDGMTDFA